MRKTTHTICGNDVDEIHRRKADNKASNVSDWMCSIDVATREAHTPIVCNKMCTTLPNKCETDQQKPQSTYCDTQFVAVMNKRSGRGSTRKMPSWFSERRRQISGFRILALMRTKIHKHSTATTFVRCLTSVCVLVTKHKHNYILMTSLHSIVAGVCDSH